MAKNMNDADSLVNTGFVLSQVPSARDLGHPASVTHFLQSRRVQGVPRKTCKVERPMPNLKIMTHIQSSSISAAVLVVLVSVTGCFSEPRNSAPVGQAAIQRRGSARQVLVEPERNLVGERKKRARGGSGAGSKSLHRHCACQLEVQGDDPCAPAAATPELPADGLSYTELAPDGYTAIGQLPGACWFWKSDGFASNPSARRLP